MFLNHPTLGELSKMLNRNSSEIFLLNHGKSTMGILWRRTHPHPSHWNQIQFYLPWVVLKQVSRNIPYMDAKRQAVHKRVDNTFPLNPNQTIFIVAPKFLQPACHAKKMFDGLWGAHPPAMQLTAAAAAKIGYPWRINKQGSPNSTL